MLDDFTIATFEGRLGERFRMWVDGDTAVEAELIGAESLVAPREGPGTRAPFSIVFLGPTEPVFPQRIYRFEHEELGEFDLFVVPIGQDEIGTSYEAVFS
jgi:hypothetical protein